MLLSLPRGVSTGKLNIYTIYGSKYCAKKELNPMITELRRYKHPSSSANRLSDVGVTVNINAEFNLMAINPIIECFSRNLVIEYCEGLKSSAVYTAPPIFVKTLHGCSNRIQPPLPLHGHAQATICTVLTLNISMRLCLPNALTLT